MFAQHKKPGTASDFMYELDKLEFVAIRAPKKISIGDGAQPEQPKPAG